MSSVVDSSLAPPVAETSERQVQITYDDDVVRKFAFATLLWGAVGMLVGLVIALQLAFVGANVHAMLSFGRLRPLHTNAVIFAFVGNMVFAGVYHSTQRLLKARMASDALSKIHFWGWQAIIVAAAISLPLGFSQGKEYAELEWPIDIAIALIWVVFAVNFFWTLAKRNEKHLYVAIWFYIATIITVALLHIVNSLAIPVTLTKSYSVFGGAQDALVQWWYGHNAVAFFLTTPVLGIMYYYLPKAAERPVYSYRLSIIHFWALIFVYIWAGPHHLLNTALPNWAQSLGMVFSLMLWAPSWGGMLNGLFTLRGAWHKVRIDPVLKFFAAGVTFYGMATFEGPMLSIKSVSSLTHYTDWIVGHVHLAALGWNGFMAAGLLYWLIPKLYGRALHSTKLADLHFWIGTAGIILYVLSMYVSGVTQGMMLRVTNADGSLMYPTFVETVLAIRPMYWTRLAGGTLYLVGYLMMAYNLVLTARAGSPVTTTVNVVVPNEPPPVPWSQLLTGRPVILVVVVLVILGGAGISNMFVSPMLFAVAGVVTLFGALAWQSRLNAERGWHRILEGRALTFTVLATLAVIVGGVAELLPGIVTKADPAIAATTSPYSPLELEGRDVYLKEGCYNCHSQMIRPMPFETVRYGEVSELKDSAYDHPFQWGSKRTGPDLAREGGRLPNLWHYQHLVDPRVVTPGSNMPSYAHLAQETTSFEGIAPKMRAMAMVGVPYRPADIDAAATNARKQSESIAVDLRANKVAIASDSRMIALIAYLQRIGKLQPPAPVPAPAVVSLEPKTKGEVSHAP